MKILLAEDEVLLREGLALLLERANHHVVASLTDATSLLEYVRDSSPSGLPDLLITDVRMPPGNRDDGLKAAIELRRTFPRMPILLLSQYMGNEYLQVLLESVDGDVESGGVGYLLKDRVGHVSEFLCAIDAVRAGGVVVDSKVITALMGRKSAKLATLTPREREVLRHVSAGETNHKISSSLSLSEGAVVKHIGSIFDKLGLASGDGNRRVLAVLAYLDEG